MATQNSISLRVEQQPIPGRSESACVNGQQYDDMWWECSGQPLNPVLGVNPGDAVTAVVVRASANGQYGWWWEVADDTTGQSESASSPVGGKTVPERRQTRG